HYRPIEYDIIQVAVFSLCLLMCKLDLLVKLRIYSFSIYSLPCVMIAAVITRIRSL
ncbi:uncharacterized protein NEPG_02586, partial [Nematocida parisii ERTm1]